LPSWPNYGAAGTVQRLGDAIAAGDLPNQAALQVFDAAYDAVRGKPFGK
jgi:hypothetical protein